MPFLAALAPLLAKAGVAGAKFGTTAAAGAKAAAPVAKGLSAGGSGALSSLFGGSGLGGAGLSLGVGGGGATAGSGGLFSSIGGFLGNPKTRGVFRALGQQLGPDQQVPDYVQQFYGGGPFQGTNNVSPIINTANPYLSSQASLPPGFGGRR